MDADRLPPAAVMVLGGLILVATFFLPWELEGGMRFAWHAFRGVKGPHFYWPLVLLGAGLLAIGCSRPRLPGFLRTFGCIVAGLGPILFVSLFAVTAVPSLKDYPLGWRLPVGGGGVILCASGFLTRRVHDGALAKLLSTVGAVGILASLLVPLGGRMPVASVLDAVLDGQGPARFVAVSVLAAGALATLTVLIWVPGFVGAWALLVAWALLLAAPAALIALGLMAASPRGMPGVTIYPGANVLAVSLLASHGLAALCARVTA